MQFQNSNKTLCQEIWRIKPGFSDMCGGGDARNWPQGGKKVVILLNNDYKSVYLESDWDIYLDSALEYHLQSRV